jgi:hypothetical protein
MCAVFGLTYSVAQSLGYVVVWLSCLRLRRVPFASALPEKGVHKGVRP